MSMVVCQISLCVYMGIAGGSTGRVNGNTRLSFTIFLSIFLPFPSGQRFRLTSQNSSSAHYIYLSRHKTSAAVQPSPRVRGDWGRLSRRSSEAEILHIRLSKATKYTINCNNVSRCIIMSSIKYSHLTCSAARTGYVTLWLPNS